MNRELMARQMFAKGGAAFPDLSGDGQVTQKDILMGRGVIPMQEGGMAPVNPMVGMPAPQDAAMPPMAQAGGIDPAIMEQMLMQAQQSVTSLDEAESAEEVMNAMRGDEASVEERRMELADIVGPEDAQQTPESVLTLVQPVMMMAQVDQGIGGLAQEQMGQPVSGDMAQGIMSTVDMGAEEGPAPVNFRYGGAVQYFAPENANRVAGITDNTLLAQQLGMTQQQYEDAVRQAEARPGDLFRQQQNVLAGLFNTEQERAAAEKRLREQEDLTKAQMLFDLAQTGLAIAAPGPRNMSVAEKLAYAAQTTNLFPKIGERAVTLADKKAAEEARIKEQQRALDLTAYGTASQLYQQEMGDLRSAFQKAQEMAYKTEQERAKALGDIEKERLKQEAITAREEAKSAKDFKNKLITMNLEGQTKPVRDELIDQKSGLKVAYEIRSKININQENPELSTVETNYVIPKMNGKPIVKEVGDLDIQYFADADGNKQMYTRNKSISGDEFKPFLINGQPVYSELAKLQWQDGVNSSGLPSLDLVNTVTGDIVKRHQKRPELEYRTIKSGNKDVIVAINKATGEHVGTPFTGSANFDYITMGDNLLKLDPVSGKTESIYTAPGSPVIKEMQDGRLHFVYKPTKDNPNGQSIPVHGSVPKAKKYDYETWIDPETSEIVNLFSVNDGRERYYAELTAADGSAVQLNPTELSRLTRISDDTAYNAAIDLNDAQRNREEYLQALTDQYGAKLQTQDNLEPVVNEVHGEVMAQMAPEKRREYREEMIDRLEQVREDYNVYSDLARDIRNGTGFFNKLKVLVGTGVSMFGGNLWKDNIDANSAVRAISLSLRMAAANSPRLAEGEQVRLAKIMADADRWLTSGDIELTKARVLKRNIQEEYVYVLQQLKNKRTLSAPVVTALEQSKQALQQAMRVMEVIVPYGQERIQRSNKLKGVVEGAKAEQREQ